MMSIKTVSGTFHSIQGVDYCVLKYPKGAIFIWLSDDGIIDSLAFGITRGELSIPISTTLIGDSDDASNILAKRLTKKLSVPCFLSSCQCSNVVDVERELLEIVSAM